MGTKEQELDLTTLDDVFSINYDNLPKDKQTDREEIEVDYNDPIEILKANIKKANLILDKIQEQIECGNFTARMVEVAGGIINGITAASKEIITKENYQGYLEVRKELNALKEREVVIKEKSGVKGGVTNQNLIITNREDLLRIMSDKKPKKISEVKKIPEETRKGE
jgi:hypothetical protein